MKTPIIKKFILFVLILFLGACSAEVTKEPLDEVTVQLVWKHQAQFAGFYAAVLNGFYTDENIEVTLRARESPEFDVVNSVVTGEADFGINYGVGVFESRVKNLPVTAIAAIYKRYPLSFFSLHEKGISSPLDFVGHKFPLVSPGGASIILDILLKKNNIDRKSIIFVPIGYDLGRFFSGDVDVWAGYTINEILIMEREGHKINQIKPEEFGVNMVGDTLFTSHILLNTNPDLVLRFVRASLRGWKWAVKHLETTGEMALQFDSTLDPVHQIAMMKASLPYITGSSPLGMMDETIWKEMYNNALELGIIEKPFNIKSAYTNTFVNKTYPDR